MAACPWLRLIQTAVRLLELLLFPGRQKRGHTSCFDGNAGCCLPVPEVSCGCVYTTSVQRRQGQRSAQLLGPFQPANRGQVVMQML